jgi:HD-like signal output (HDOD) protein
MRKVHRQFDPETLTYRSDGRSVAADNSTAKEGLRALEFLGQVAAELSRGTVSLPCFPDVVVQIRDALSDPHATLKECLKLIGTEPVLAGKLMQMANSAAFNPQNKPVTGLKSAVTRLGQEMVQSAALAFAVQQMKSQASLASISDELRELWDASIAVAGVARVLAAKVDIRVEEAFLAGLLHAIGRLYILARSASDSPEISPLIRSSALIADWHPSIAKAILQNWRLPEASAEAIGSQNDLARGTKGPPDLTDLIIVSIAMASKLQSQAGKEKDEEEMRQINAYLKFKMNAAEYAEVLRNVEYQLDFLHEMLRC